MIVLIRYCCDCINKVRRCASTYLLQTLVVLRVDRFKVVVGHRLTEHVLVKRPREVSVQQLAVADGLANHATHEFEVAKVLAVDPRLTGQNLMRCVGYVEG